MSAAKLEALKAGRELPVTAEELVGLGSRPGDVPPTDVRAVLDLAVAIHRAESGGVAISWSAQERAQSYFNEHGLAATLDEARRLEA